MFTTTRRVCPYCGQFTTLVIPNESWKVFNKTNDAGLAFPFFDDNDLCVLATGLCYDCQQAEEGDEPYIDEDEMFGINDCDESYLSDDER